jgi:Sec-independent protein translocase protein TatA
MFGVGGGEILVIALVAVILFGTDDLPKNMRKFMKAWNNFRGVTNDLQRGWLDVRDQVTRDILTDRPEHPQEPSLQVEAQQDSPQGASQDLGTPQTEIESAAQTSAPQTQDGEEGPDVPMVRPAVGSIAQGDFQKTSSEQINEPMSSPVAPDKST